MLANSSFGIGQLFSLQGRSSVGEPKQDFPLGPFAETAKKRLRFCVPSPHVLLHLLHGPKSDHIQSTVRFKRADNKMMFKLVSVLPQ